MIFTIIAIICFVFLTILNAVDAKKCQTKEKRKAIISNMIFCIIMLLINICVLCLHIATKNSKPPAQESTSIVYTLEQKTN